MSNMLSEELASSIQAAKEAWVGRSVTSVEEYSKHDLDCLFELVKNIRNEPTEALLNICKGKVMACAFYEASTRTNCSFNAAMQRMGGSVLSINASSSSVKKGETLSDTMRTLACYTDVVVLRHPEKGSAKVAAESITSMELGGFREKAVVINAGDGAGEHPTQALLDMFTILDEKSKSYNNSSETPKVSGNPLMIVMCGDLKYGRTTHSLAKLVCLYANTVIQGANGNCYQGIQLVYVAPTSLQMPQEIMEYVNSKNGIEQLQESELTSSLLMKADVLYMTRIQKERFPDEDSYNAVKDSFVLTSDHLKSEKANPSLTIMHPLPRVGEITLEVDVDPRAAYFRQMENGMYVRMALVAAILGASTPTPL